MKRHDLIEKLVQRADKPLGKESIFVRKGQRRRITRVHLLVIKAQKHPERDHQQHQHVPDPCPPQRGRVQMPLPAHVETFLPAHIERLPFHAKTPPGSHILRPLHGLSSPSLPEMEKPLVWIGRKDRHDSIDGHVPKRCQQQGIRQKQRRPGIFRTNLLRHQL